LILNPKKDLFGKNLFVFLGREALGRLSLRGQDKEFAGLEAVAIDLRPFRVLFGKEGPEGPHEFSDGELPVALRHDAEPGLGERAIPGIDVGDDGLDEGALPVAEGLVAEQPFIKSEIKRIKADRSEEKHHIIKPAFSGRGGEIIENEAAREGQAGRQEIKEENPLFAIDSKGFHTALL
jgi:hypothetical protein